MVFNAGFQNSLSFRPLWISNNWQGMCLPPQPSKTYALAFLSWVTIMFSHLCPSASHHCDKMPDEVKLKERKFIMAHGFQIQIMDNWLCCYSPQLRQGNSDHRNMWLRGLLTSWEVGKREKKVWGQAVAFNAYRPHSGLPSPAQCHFPAAHLATSQRAHLLKKHPDPDISE